MQSHDLSKMEVCTFMHPVTKAGGVPEIFLEANRFVMRAVEKFKVFFMHTNRSRFRENCSRSCSNLSPAGHSPITASKSHIHNFRIK